MKTIEKLEPSRHVQGRFLVWFEGERDPVKVTENEVAAFSLYRGRTLETDELERLLNAGSASSARALGARMLGQRPLSRKELIKRMVDKGVPEADAESAADWLADIGALNELDYARSIVRHYDGRGYGEQKLRQELIRRGIAREHWDAAMAERGEAEDSVLRFLRTRLRGRAPDEKELKRTTDALMRRGFRWDEIKTGLARYGMEIEEESI